MITQEVGSRIRQLRKERGISQEKFAIKAEIDRTYLPHLFHMPSKKS